MAEVVGIISGSIAIGQAAAAIASSLIKLKELWNEFRDVPQELVFLVRQIEILHLLFEENETQVIRAGPISPPRSVERAFELVNNGAQELDALVEELQLGLKQRQGWKAKVATAKVVLKNSQIKRCKTRLKATIALLNLAKQCQITSMLEMQPSYLVAIMEEVSQLQKVRSGDEGNDKESSSLQVSLKETQHRRDPGSELMFRFKLRFLSRQWNLCVYQSQIGWNCGLRTWNLIPPHTPVWWCIEDDDVNGLRELFETGAASPFDLIDFGSPLGPSTLLSAAVAWGSIKSVRFLLDQGLNTHEESIENGSTVMRQFLCTAYTFLKMKGTTEMSEYQIYMSIGEMLLQDFERIAFQPSLYHSGVDYGLLGWFRGTLSAFQLVQAAYCRNYYELPLKHRAKISTMLLRCNTPDTAMAALGTISSLGIDQPFTEIGSSRPPITLFEAVANRFGSELFEPSYQPSSKELFKPLWDSSEVDQENGITLRPLFDPKTYPLCGWQALVGHILNKGADPNRCGLFGTPLIQMLRGAYSWGWREVKLVDVPHRSFGYRYIFRRPHRKGSEVLLTWLQTLRGFGIDLERYGKSEHKLFYRKDSPGRDLRLCDVGGDIYHLRLVGLQVGPAPEDWNVWLSEPSDEFARDFWDMLEHPERTIPGAWDDFTW